MRWRTRTLLEDEVPEAQLASIATQFNLELGPTLWGQVRFIKLCPAPDGQGAHLVLATEAGPVTLFYLPGLEGGNGEQFRIDGMHAWVADLETGALVVIASPEQPLEQFASLVRDEFRVNEL